jgi:hypothetical protein
MPDDLDPLLSRMLKEHDKEELSDLFAFAVDRWLDKQFAKFGKWAVAGVAAALFAWIVKLYVASGGVK